jgi:hypothetical protein
MSVTTLMSKTTNKFAPEVHAPAVRMVLDQFIESVTIDPDGANGRKHSVKASDQAASR